MNIFVAKLSRNTTSDSLRGLFEQYGQVSSAKVIFDRETGNSKCFGFVEMDDDSEANDSINNLNESQFEGATIVVKKARPKEDGGFAPRSGGGGNYNRDNNREFKRRY